MMVMPKFQLEKSLRQRCRSDNAFEVVEFGKGLKRYLWSPDFIKQVFKQTDLDLISVDEQIGYQSKRINQDIPYILCRARRNRI
jgi:hypothetical protein